jgi:uncharacterized repeat protein (TIGR01451 family)
MSAAPEAADGMSPRPSRQDLVIPPRHSSWPVAAGVVASALAGFGLVFFLGIGRSRPATPPADSAPAVAVASVDPAVQQTAALDPADAPPALLPPLDPGATAPPAERWPPRGDRGEEDAAENPADRYATRPVSHEDLPPVAPATEQPPRSLSRFSSADLPPPEEPPADPAGRSTGPADQDPIDAEPAAVIPIVSPPAEPAAEPGLEPPAEPGLEPALPPAEFDAAANEPEPSAREPAFSEPASPPAEPESPITGGPPEAMPFAPAARSPAAASPVRPPAPLDTGDEPRAIAAPPRDPRAADAAAPPAAQPWPAAIPVGLPPPPFATAPLIGPPQPLAAAESTPPSAAPSPPPAAEPPAGIEGQGVPGPIQLEGVQTPQLTVEKRGPKEIQVGQPARFEILVRNVGSATAHEVTLRDEVPRGTSLIATTPPAAPADGGAPAELVWLLGDLPPGEETRVLVELMPEAEGEVGSVASVSFRADATLRARATKPALAIDCPPPEPVRIGGDVEVTLTISNPGSGTATGIVLEAFLPETVSHRAGPELEFDVGQLRPGESKTIDLVLGTRSPGRAPARFVARADGGIEIDQPLPIPVTAPTLEVAIEMPARRFLQRPATCTISMVNAGTASARAVELAAQLPPGMKFVRANHAGWHDERTHRVLWNLEELPPGETGTVEVVVMPVQAGGQRLTAAARSTDGPSDQAIHVCQVEGLAALAFHVADSEDPIEVDGVTEYVIRVSNEGTKAASGVRLAATLLGDLEPVEAQGPGRHRVENAAVEFEPLAKLGPGEDAVYKIRARGRRAGHQRVQVQLVSDDQPTPITKEEVTSVYDDR